MREFKIPAAVKPRVRRPDRTLFALGALLAVGIALRGWLVYQYAPGFVGYDDSRGYLATLIAPNLYWQPVRPAGYPIFLLVAKELSSHLRSAIVLQHALGVATAVLLYLAVAKIVRRRWVALLPAAVILLGGSQIYLEHAVVTESVFTFLVALALWMGVLSIHSPRRALWLIPAGAAIGAAITLRSVGITLIPGLMLWAVLAKSGSIRMRIAAPLAVLAGVLLTLGPYLLHQHSKTDSWGLTRTTGWTLAARMSTFADCSKFTPPAGTEAMCDDPIPAVRRPNAAAYQFDPAVSPALRKFGSPLADYTVDDPQRLAFAPDGLQRKFALAVVRHQFGTYLGTVGDGLVKYVNPRWGRGRTLEWPQSTLITELHNEGKENVSLPEAAIAYKQPLAFLRRASAPLDGYVRFANLEGWPTVLLVLLAAAGWVLARGVQRTASALLGLVTLTLIISPVALLFYGARYAAPMYGPLAAAAALGLDSLVSARPGLTARVRKLRNMRPRRPSGDGDSDELSPANATNASAAAKADREQHPDGR